MNGKPPARVPASVVDLVERFPRDRKVFQSPDYKEEQLLKAKTSHEQESLKRTIAATDRQIDALVFALYGLTEYEAGIVEGGQCMP